MIFSFLCFVLLKLFLHIYFIYMMEWGKSSWTVRESHARFLYTTVLDKKRNQGGIFFVHFCLDEIFLISLKSKLCVRRYLNFSFLIRGAQIEWFLDRVRMINFDNTVWAINAKLWYINALFCTFQITSQFIQCDSPD